MRGVGFFGCCVGFIVFEDWFLSMKVIFQKVMIEVLTEKTSLYLDFSRFVLSQLVLIGHAASFFGVMDFFGPPIFPWVQSIAVVGFFWLSGFLICYSTIRKLNRPEYGFGVFFLERFSRIYSAFIPALLFVICIDGLFQIMKPGVYGFYKSYAFDVALGNILMLFKFPVQILQYPMFGSASAWWTLGIEWWLYMAFGWLLLKDRDVLYYVGLFFYHWFLCVTLYMMGLGAV